MALINSFNKTSLDLENSDPNGGPINDPASGYLHKNLPGDPNSHYQSIVSTANSPLANPITFQKTNLDLEDPLQTGGPINDPASGFNHIYTPNNTYTNNRPR
jgi:hypothetical protein